ncbi:MAG: O-antigen ligase C-terminal domain-containing protein [Ramlibacter sp.]|nr:O-antigen ligase C-terminal domain-containing protein [Ramlibacter sp.]
MIRAFLPVMETPPWGRFSLGALVALVGGPSLLLVSWLATEHFPPWVSWHLEAAAFVAVYLSALTGLAVVLRRRKSFTVGIPAFVMPLVALIGVVQFQAQLGIVPFWGDALVVTVYIALCITCLTIGFNAGSNLAKSHRPGAEDVTLQNLLAWTLAAGALLSAVIAFAQVFELWESAGWIVRMPDLRRPGGNLGQANQLATLLVMGMASMLFLYATEKLSHLTSALMFMVLAAGLALTESRAGALSMLMLLVWWQIKRKAVAPHIPVLAGPACAAVFAGMFFAWPRLLEFLQIVDGSIANRFTAGSLRFQIWPQLLEAAWQHPWTGWGAMGVSRAHNAVADAYTVSEPYSYSHNFILDATLWFGLPMAIGMVTMGCWWLNRRVREASSATPWFCLAVALPMVLHSLLEYPYAYAYFLVPVFLLIGVLEGAAGAPAVFNFDVKVALAISLLLSALMLATAVEYMEAEEDFRIVRFEALKIGTTPPSHHEPRLVLLTQLGALLSGSRIEIRNGMPPSEIQRLRDLALRYPWSATQYRYALALALNGDKTEAIRQLKVMRSQRGDKLYGQIKDNIKQLSLERYPELRSLALP